MRIQRLYYTLPELAEKWTLSENDLLHMAARGDLELSARHVGTGLSKAIPHRKKVDGYVQLYPNVAKWILENGIRKYHEVSIVKWHGAEVAFLGPLLPTDPDYIYEERPVVLYNNSNLLILPEEVKRVEAIYGLSVQIAQQSSFVDDDPWIKGDRALCKAFGVKATSITSVRNKVKTTEGIEFGYDPETKEKRLRASAIVTILAGA